MNFHWADCFCVGITRLRLGFHRRKCVASLTLAMFFELCDFGFFGNHSRLPGFFCLDVLTLVWCVAGVSRHPLEGDH